MPDSHHPRYELRVLVNENFSEATPSKEELEVLRLVLGRLWGRVSERRLAKALGETTSNTAEDQGVKE